MNVLLITQTLSSGGAERSITKLSKLFSANANVLILVIDETKSIDFNYAGRLIYLKDYLEKKNFFPFLQKVKAIRRIKRENNVNVSISFLEGPNFSNIVSRVSDRVFVSVRGHKSSFYKKAGNKWKWLIEKLAIRFLYNFSDKVIAVSLGVAEDLHQNLGVKKNKIKVIPNFYNSSSIIAKSKESVGSYDDILNSNPVLITTGRLSVPKGHNHLLEIYDRLKKKYGNLKLVVIGDGELYDDFIKNSLKYGFRVFSWRDNSHLNDSYDVFLTGVVSNPFAYMVKATIFVFTSLWEGFPNALAEAIVCGVPVAASDCLSGPRELLFENLSYNSKVEYPLQSKYGVLLPAFSLINDNLEEIYKVWVESLGTVIDQSANRPQIDSASFAQRFSEDAIVKLWRELLN